MTDSDSGDHSIYTDYIYIYMFNTFLKVFILKKCNYIQGVFSRPYCTCFQGRLMKRPGTPLRHYSSIDQNVELETYRSLNGIHCVIIVVLTKMLNWKPIGL
jgi:hypothetical protein